MAATSELDAAFLAASSRKPGKCWRQIIKLEPVEAEALDRALANPAVTGTGISTVLKNLGHTVSGASVQHHRNGQCACD